MKDCHLIQKEREKFQKKKSNQGTRSNGRRESDDENNAIYENRYRINNRGNNSDRRSSHNSRRSNSRSNHYDSDEESDGDDSLTFLGPKILIARIRVF